MINLKHFLGRLPGKNSEKNFRSNCCKIPGTRACYLYIIASICLRKIREYLHPQFGFSLSCDTVPLTELAALDEP
jgi:hypothetical protein